MDLSSEQLRIWSFETFSMHQTLSVCALSVLVHWLVSKSQTLNVLSIEQLTIFVLGFKFNLPNDAEVKFPTVALNVHDLIFCLIFSTLFNFVSISLIWSCWLDLSWLILSIDRSNLRNSSFKAFLSFLKSIKTMLRSLFIFILFYHVFDV